VHRSPFAHRLLCSGLLLLAASDGLVRAPGRARAFEGELCPMPQVPRLRSLVEVDDGSATPVDAMCSDRLPHVLRPPGLMDAEQTADRESEESAPLVAAQALERARALIQAGLYDDALLNLRVVEATMPRIVDHIALQRAELHALAGDPLRAADAYRTALQASKSMDLAARAQVGFVESLLQAQQSQGVKELVPLLQRYPELPEAPRLRFELAQYYERAGQLKSAIAGYRALDLTLPGYAAAEHARERLARLAEQGHKIAPYTPTEQIDRTERLIRSGNLELARVAVDALRSTKLKLPKPLIPRCDAVIDSFEAKLGGGGPPLAGPVQLERERRLAFSTTPLKLAKARPFQLFGWLQAATQLGAHEIADRLLLSLAKRAALVPADVRFDALVIATGNASDDALLELADTLVQNPSLGVAARYHRARCLERLKQADRAREELLRVVATDTSATRFYSQFANQRLRLLNGESLDCQAPGRRVECNREEIEGLLARLERPRAIDTDEIVAQLSAIASDHGSAYPWLLRALDLVKLGELSAAGDELHEAYLAFRWVARRGPLNAGRIAIYRGRSVVQPAPDAPTRFARLSLNGAARNALAQVAFALGDVGTAIEFGGTRYAESHPEPYADEVARVARKYGLDPDLLFAIMRVESVYHRRIISHAGAIGLMQIMPRTGRLIADKLGISGTTAADLLDPKYNLELSGWYLSALLERMDGRLPLAIASYNGGPHNVRRWIDQFGEHLPLDAFLERIPFTETKRYVRRVLGYYAQYKAVRGESVDLMSLTLPKDKPDGVKF
jgi:soluble lytic murein transglycosylase